MGHTLMQDSPIGTLIQAPVDLLANPADRLRASAKTGEAGGSRDIKKTAQEFESLFVTYLLKVMRETIEEANESESGSGKSIYTELFDQEFARGVAQQRGLGIGDLIIRSLETVHSGSGPTPGRSPVIGSGAVSQAPANPRESSSATSTEYEGTVEVPDFRLPIQATVSSGYGMRKDPFTHAPRFHKGLDIAAPAGMEIRAAAGGEVVYSGYDPSYGNTVVVKHTGGLETRYAHLGRIDVRKGNFISAEQVLGSVGSTGHSTGPHLHFEVTRWGKTINPLAAAALKTIVNNGVRDPHQTGAESKS
jgi:murein DD-endopeptidase MepM/ murein hydrolase activator NlpD